jgi:glycosyltransferase involved in cell wall biosynthesis
MKTRLALLCDYPEEHWVSMDLVAEMLYLHLVQGHAQTLSVQRLCPPFRRRALAVPWTRTSRLALNADRIINRLREYPRYARGLSREFDVFHVVDHSYAALVHALPADRTGVFCHDLDAFGSILRPSDEPRPRWYRAMSRHILRGLQKAAVIFHSTAEIRRQIVEFGVVDPARLVHAPYGIAQEFRMDGGTPPAALREVIEPGPFVLHVGSCVRRKRIDVLLDTFALLHESVPGIRLIQAGGTWSEAQQEQIQSLRIGEWVVQLPRQTRESIAHLYRRARVVLMPSEAEGFGLPVAEALACGAIVVASDIPVLREVGGEAAVYLPLGDVRAWAAATAALLADPQSTPPMEERLRQASRYSWAAHAATIADTYIALASR